MALPFFPAAIVSFGVASSMMGAAALGRDLLANKNRNVTAPLTEQRDMLQSKLRGMSDNMTTARNDRLNILSALSIPGKSRRVPSKRRMMFSNTSSNLANDTFPVGLI